MLIRTTGLDEGWRIWFQDGVFIWLLAECLSSLLHGRLFMELLEYPHNMGLDFP